MTSNMNTTPIPEGLLYPAYSLEDLEAELDHAKRAGNRKKINTIREAIRQRVAERWKESESCM
ncbi:hypothetical protein J8F10_24340 [Gemmata sp. G18]|uniref:Ribbon-helix-helix protein, CopG family n=1 Tax=Gemmata palustris TaxID=2822762 RepID=A0ABS5BXF7_9BACT|nr:hypothetical protein [Gemmata palustris]MBP3958391.1 hypothetical protein [Gemmata palustris]